MARGKKLLVLLKDALSRNLVDTCSAGLTVDLTISVRQHGDNSFLLPPKQILPKPDQHLLAQGCTFATMSSASYSFLHHQASQSMEVKVGTVWRPLTYHLRASTAIRGER
ncbi:hypothetical protein PVAP13_7KG123241 [Panicum virgatum]|uniref:Uncharacterized protein n=1 Tax=Panicum virgatum TaxID=38727 RepID=A0A8T0QD58_PANVG|nr:hypothetical protein PVAP13_7KG123241 [Panicum virgatum]